jgi:Na+/melibiose symporter-like transporter
MALFNAVGSLLPLMLAEIYDYQQWKTGKRLEGFIQTFAYAVVLMATQFALLIPAVIQAKMGYTPNTYFDKEVHQVTNAEIKTALDYYKTALIISIISGALFILVMLFYNLDKNKYEKIMAELKEKNLNTEINQTNDEDLNTTNPTDGSIESLAEDLKSEHINTIETENNQAV